MPLAVPVATASWDRPCRHSLGRPRSCCTVSGPADCGKVLAIASGLGTISRVRWARARPLASCWFS